VRQDAKASFILSTYSTTPSSTFTMEDRSRHYILGAFVLGAALTAAVNRRSSNTDSHQDGVSSKQNLEKQKKSTSKLDDQDLLKKSSGEANSSLGKGAGSIKEGIEGCIGGTPLIRIKSLSEYTGCEILAKAEV